MITDKIKRLIINTVLWLSCLTIIFFFSTLWIYSYNDTEQAFHEAWSTSVSFLSALSTLTAAVVAAYLFNDWRNQPKLEIKLKINKNIKLMKDIIVNLRSYEYAYDFSEEKFNDFNLKIREFCDSNNEIKHLLVDYEIISSNDESQSSAYKEINDTLEKISRCKTKICIYYDILKSNKNSEKNIEEAFDDKKRIFINAEIFFKETSVPRNLYDMHGHLILDYIDIGKELSCLFEDLIKQVKALT